MTEQGAKSPNYGMLYFSRGKIALILAVVFLGIFFSLPNLLPHSAHQYWPSWLPWNQIRLGATADGGTTFVLQVDRPAMMKEYLFGKRKEVRDLLREAKLAHVGILFKTDHLHAKFRTSADREDAFSLLDSRYNSWLEKPMSLNRNGSEAIDISISKKRLDELVDRSLQSLIDGSSRVRR